MRSLITVMVASLMLFQCSNEKNQGTKKDWSSTYQVESGKPVSMTLTIYKTTMLADGRDNVKARVAVIDSTGREIKTSTIPFRIYVTGDASITGENLNLVKTDTINYHEAKLVNGTFNFVLQAGTKPDKIKLEVKADSLWSASHEIHTIPADFKMMKPSGSQLKVRAKKLIRCLVLISPSCPKWKKEG